MKRLDSSKSPTRKQLVKKAINYFGQLKDMKKFDKPRKSSHSKENKKPPARDGSHEEAYVDQEHRHLKLDKLRELMETELTKADIDGELHFKRKDIEKAYSGYPMCMLRKEVGSTARERLGSVDSQGHPKRPLVEELKDAVDEAADLDSCHEEVHKPDVHKLGNKYFVDEKLYYLEIERAQEYQESPLNKCFDFHQRKAKEIRRLQYATTLTPKKNKPTHKLNMLAKRGGSKEITKFVENIELRVDSPVKLIEDSYPEQDKKFVHGISIEPATHGGPDDISLYTNPTPLDDGLFEYLNEPEEDLMDSVMHDTMYGSDEEPIDEWIVDHIAIKPHHIAASIHRSSYLHRMYRAPACDNFHKTVETIKASKVYRRHVVEPCMLDKVEESANIDKIYTRKVTEDCFGKFSQYFDETYIERIYSKHIVESFPEKYQQHEDKCYIHKVYSRPRVDPSPDKYLKREDQTYVKKVYTRPRIDASPDRYLKTEDRAYIQKINKRPRIDPSPERYQKNEDQTYIHKINKRPHIEPSPEKYTKSEDRTYIDKVYIRPHIEPSPDKYLKNEDTTYIDKVYTRPHIEPSPEKYRGDCDQTYIQKIHSRPILDPSPDKFHKEEDQAYIKKVYKRPLIEPSPDKYYKEEDKSYIKKIYNKPPLEPSPEKYDKKEDKAYVQRVYNRPMIEPSPDKYHKEEDRTYVQKVYKRPLLEASPEKYNKEQDQVYISKVYRKPLVDPSPEKYHKTEDATYIKKIYSRPPVEPSPERYHQQEDTAYIKKIYRRPSLEPSPEKYQKDEDMSYIKKVYNKPLIEASPDKYYKQEDSSYISKVYRKPLMEGSPDKYHSIHESVYLSKVFRRPHIEPSPERYHQNHEQTYVKQIYPHPRAEPSPEKYEKREDKAYIHKVYNRHRAEPSPERYLKSEEKVYINKIYKRPRIEPSPEKYSKKEETVYAQKVYKRHRCEPSPERNTKKMETSYIKNTKRCHRPEPSPERYLKREEKTYIQKVYNRHRAEPSPKKYSKKEESAYVSAVFKKARGIPVAAIASQYIETVYIWRVYRRKVIPPAFIAGKVDSYQLQRTIFWESAMENLSEKSFDDQVAEPSELSSVESAVESLSEALEEPEEVKEDAHISENEPEEESEPEITIEEEIEAIEIYPSGHDNLSVRNKDDLDVSQENSEPSEIMYTRTRPDEKFPVWVLTDSDPIPAMISSPDGFLVDIESGKMEIKTGDKALLEPKDSQGFVTTNDKIRKKNPRIDPDCDFVVFGTENQRLPVVIELRSRNVKDANCTLYDPEDRVIGRAHFDLKEIDETTQDPYIYCNAILLDENDKVREVLVKTVPSDLENLLVKRSPTSTLEETIMKDELVTLLGDISCRMITMDPERHGKNKAELLFMPTGPYKIMKSKLLDNENGFAECTNLLDYEGSILVETLDKDGNLQVYIVIPEAKRNTELGKRPEFVKVDFDGRIRQDIKDFADFKEAVIMLLEKAEQKIINTRKPRPMGLEQIDIKIIDEEDQEAKLNIGEQGRMPTNPEKHIQHQFVSVQDNSALCFQVEHHGKLIKASDAKKPTPPTKGPTPKNINKYTGIRPPTNWSHVNSSKVELPLAPKPTGISAVSSPGSSALKNYASLHSSKPKQRMLQSARLLLDKKQQPTNKSEVKTSNPPTPRGYTTQVKELKSHAASTIAIYWRYSKKKQYFRVRYRSQYDPIRRALKCQSLYRRFFIEYMTTKNHKSLQSSFDAFLTTVKKNVKP